jgi:hypothetical protein
LFFNPFLTKKPEFFFLCITRVGTQGLSVKGFLNWQNLIFIHEIS